MERYVEFLQPENAENDLIKLAEDMKIVLLSAVSSFSKPQIAEDLYKKGENMFWKKIYAAKKDDVGEIEMVYVKSCSHYIIADTYKAPVIEIRRSGSACQNVLIWAAMYYYDGSKMVYKGEEFERLYKSIETWIKLNCEVVKDLVR